MAGATCASTTPTRPRRTQEYIDAIERDVRWLGFDWGAHLHHASDYFDQLYDWAEHLIRSGNAYVDDLSRARRCRRCAAPSPSRAATAPTAAATWRRTSTCFRRMRAGEFPNGARTLRAKIDMAAGNINLRDPVLYRILHATHPRTGDAMVHLSDL